MQFSRCAKAVVAALGLAFSLGVKAASAGDVLAEISVRNREHPSTYHGEMFVFPETVREYSRERFYGWSFRHDLRDGAVRLLEVARARTRGCRMVQLTTDRSRREARQFYEGLGFVASHHGMKLHLKA